MKESAHVPVCRADRHRRRRDPRRCRQSAWSSLTGSGGLEGRLPRESAFFLAGASPHASRALVRCERLRRYGEALGEGLGDPLADGLAGCSAVSCLRMSPTI